MCFQVKVGDSEKVALSREGRQTDGSFLAPQTRKLFTFDPMRQEATVVGDAPGTPEHEAYRKAVAEKLREYITNHYPEGENLKVFLDFHPALVTKKYCPFARLSYYYGTDSTIYRALIFEGGLKDG